MMELLPDDLVIAVAEFRITDSLERSVVQVKKCGCVYATALPISWISPASSHRVKFSHRLFQARACHRRHRRIMAKNLLLVTHDSRLTEIPDVPFG